MPKGRDARVPGGAFHEDHSIQLEPRASHDDITVAGSIYRVGNQLYVLDDVGFYPLRHPPGGGGGVIPFNAAFAAGNFQSLVQTQPDWTVKSSFVFAGTAVLGTYTLAKAVVWRITGTGTGHIKIYDLTNDLDIAEASFANSEQTILTLGALSNLPAGEAVFEVQMKRTGNGTFCCAGLEMR